ncbi:MAG: AtpZ/AtpI family protein [Nitrospirota bacterium]|jgi:ATP synthase protein I|nr:AtpZ/AtpI family protein [Nitrospirota bacterium]
MPEKSLFKQLLEASTVGLNLVLATAVGLAMGYGIDYAMDKWFGLHTRPWFTIIFLIIGIISGFRDLFRIARRSNNESDKKDL